MKGIHCALQGRLGADVELRRSAGGKDWARLSVGVLEAAPSRAVSSAAPGRAVPPTDDLSWVSVAVFEEKAVAAAGLLKGAEVYVEGRLSLNVWTGKDGVQRTGLSVTAWEVIPLGQIGRKRPPAGLLPQRPPAGLLPQRPPRPKPPESIYAMDEPPPFDDPLRF